MTATEVTIPSDSPVLYKELVKQRLAGNDLWSYLYCGYIAVDWRSRNPAATVAMITARLTACGASVQQGLAGDDLAMAYPSAETAGLRAAVLAVRGVGDDVGNFLGTLVSAPAQAVRKLLLPEADKFPDWQAAAFGSQAPDWLQLGTDAILGVIADAAAADPDLRSALDAFALSSGNKIGLAWPAPGSATANRDVLAMAGDWPALYKEGLQSDGSIIVSVQSLAGELDAQVLAATAVASGMSGQVQAADASIASAAPGASFALDDLSLDFNTVLAGLSAAARPAAASASNSVSTAASNNDAALKYAQNGISGIAQVIAIIDPEAANLINATATILVSAATAISDFAKTTTTLNQLLGTASVIGEAVGGALLTGDMVGALMSIIGLFAGPAPNPQMVLLQSVQKAINQVGQQVTALKKDVDARLDHIDAILSTVIQQVQAGFTALSDLAAINQSTLVSISSMLVQLAEQVNRVDTDMQAWLQLVEVQTGLLEQGENPVLDWRYTHIDPADILPSGADPNFVAADNTFYTWATGIAVTGPQITVAAPLDPVSIAAQLVKPLSWNINVLAGALTNLKAASFYDASTGVPLPNPVVWARAASDYAELQLEWLSYSEKLNQQRIADVAGPGLALLGALDTLATLSHPDGVARGQPGIRRSPRRIPRSAGRTAAADRIAAESDQRAAGRAHGLAKDISRHKYGHASGRDPGTRSLRPPLAVPGDRQRYRLGAANSQNATERLAVGKRAEHGDDTQPGDHARLPAAGAAQLFLF